jgi:hypothetical protein
MVEDVVFFKKGVFVSGISTFSITDGLVQMGVLAYQMANRPLGIFVKIPKRAIDIYKVVPVPFHLDYLPV